MNRLQAYELGLCVGIEKSGRKDEFIHTAAQVGRFIKAAKALRAKGKTGPKLEKLAAWYDHILPALGSGLSTGLMGASAFGPWGLLAAIPGAAYGAYQSAYGGGGSADVGTGGDIEAMKSLPPELVSTFKDVGINPAYFQPIAKPSWVTPTVERYLASMGTPWQTLMFRQRMQQEQERKKRDEEREAEVKKRTPVSYAEFSKGRPAPSMPRGPRPGIQFASYPGPMMAAGPMPPPPPFMMPPQQYDQTPPYEAPLWRKWTGMSPEQIQSKFEPMMVADKRRLMRNQFEDYARRAFSS